MTVYVQIPMFPGLISVTDATAEDVADALSKRIREGAVVSWHLPGEGGVFVQNFGRLPGVFVRGYLLGDEEARRDAGELLIADIPFELLIGGYDE